MEETARDPEPQAKATAVEPVVEHRDFSEVLKSYLGKLITVVNPESYEDAPLGHDIRKGWYPAKPIGFGNDYMIVVTEYKHSAPKTKVEPVKQYIPFHRIKRISVMKNQVCVHL